MTGQSRNRSRPRPILLVALAVVALAWGVSRQMGPATAAGERRTDIPRDPWSQEDMKDWKKPAESGLRESLSDLQYQVTQEEGTEAPFRNEYWDNKEPGIYVDIISGEPLFSSLDKYESGTGWPSFVRPLESGNVAENTDHKLGYARTEVRSKHADSHLGHVFPDGPAPTGQRYCINSASLRFVPVSELEKQGYGDYAAAFREAGVYVPSAAEGPEAAKQPADGTEVAILAGGCYWGMEDLIRDLPGVLDTEVGFSGGSVENVAYKDVTRGNTGHAESIRVVFDPEKLSFEQLLDRFFTIHDPTTPNRQGNDRGTQYRSAIFVIGDSQRQTAERVISRWNASGRWKRDIVTEIADAGTFWSAGEDHQDYLEKYPNGYTCHFVREWDE